MSDVRGPEPPVALVRPALELAWWVARLGAEARPSIDPPGPLRPFLRAAKLPDRMLATIRQVLDTDEEFRERVAAAADEDGLGRASWLWLVRPDGWEAELQDLAAGAGDAGSEKGDRARLKALERAQADLARARGELAALRQVNEASAAEARRLDQARRQAERDRDRVQTALQAARAERQALEDEMARMRAEVEAVTAALDGARDEMARNGAADLALEGEVARLEGELVDARRAQAAAAAGLTELRRVRSVVSDAVTRAGAAAAELGAALAEAGAALQPAVVAPSGPSPDDVESDGGAAAPTDRAAPGPPPPRRRPGGRPGRRQPLPLPPAVLDDSPEAAAHLVRASGVLLVVDGYNVTLSSWPGLELPEQRQRLVDALAELTARAGTTVHVVFDGISAGNRVQPPSAARRHLRVEFSPSELEADDLIISLVDELDRARPVVVATNDGRVRREVASRGANVISVDQLLAVLGRSGAGR